MSKTNTKERILRTAQDLFLAQGFAGTSVDLICDKTDVSKGNFYHFFKNKEDLGIQALDSFHKQNGEILFEGLYRTEPDPTKRVFRFLDHTAAVARQLWGNGCLLGTFSLELSESSPKVRAEVAKRFDAVINSFEPLFKFPQKSFNKTETRSSRALAEQFVATLEGYIVLSRAQKNWRKISEGIQNFRGYIENIAH